MKPNWDLQGEIFTQFWECEHKKSAFRCIINLLLAGAFAAMITVRALLSFKSPDRGEIGRTPAGKSFSCIARTSNRPKVSIWLAVPVGGALQFQEGVPFHGNLRHHWIMWLALFSFIISWQFTSFAWWAILLTVHVFKFTGNDFSSYIEKNSIF